MKTKNLLLAIIAFTFAVGGAFASMLADVPVYVWAKETADEDPSCIETDARCDAVTSTSLCQLSINVDRPGANQSVTSTGTLKTFKAGCTEVLFDQLNRGVQNIDATGEIYEVVVKPGF